MAVIFSDLGKYQKSKEILQKCCLKTRQKNGVNNTGYIIATSRLAIVELTMGNYK